MTCQSFDQIHGAMLAARATDRDRQIAAIGAMNSGNPVFQKADEVGEHPRDLRMAFAGTRRRPRRDP